MLHFLRKPCCGVDIFPQHYTFFLGSLQRRAELVHVRSQLHQLVLELGRELPHELYIFLCGGYRAGFDGLDHSMDDLSELVLETGSSPWNVLSG